MSAVAVTYAAAPFPKFNTWLLGKSYWAEKFRNETWRRLIVAFEESGLTISFLARRLNWKVREVQKALSSPASLDGIIFYGELCWALGVKPAVTLQKISDLMR